MDSGAWWATVYGVTKSRTRLKRLSTHTIGSQLLLKNGMNTQRKVGFWKLLRKEIQKKELVECLDDHLQ